MNYRTLDDIRNERRRANNQARKLESMRKPENDPGHSPSRDLPLHHNDSTAEMHRRIRRGSEELIEALRREHPDIITHLTRGRDV